MRVLVADDQAFWRQVLSDRLIEEGYEVVAAADGEEAWRRLRDDPDIAVLLTDWVMPQLTGADLCRRVRAERKGRYLPILLMTSREDAAARIEGLEAGADAFLAKPIEDSELRVQLRVMSRILALEERLAARIDELERARDRSDRELALAAEVQRATMPAALPRGCGARFAWHYEPCAGLGGDGFNVQRMSEHHVGVHVLDVSGHGTAAALHAVALSHVLHSVPQQGGLLKRVEGRTWEITPPSQVIAELNRRFPLMERSGHFFSFLYGVYDIRDRSFCYACAGHPQPILMTGQGAKVCDAEAGPPVGILSEADWPDVRIELGSGEGLLILSDGLTESRSPDGEEFGLERVLEIAADGHRHDVSRTIARICGGLELFQKQEPARDDVTLLGLRVEPDRCGV